MSRPELSPQEVFYPESDGEPMAETDLHRDLMIDLIGSLRAHFRDEPDVYVSGNLFVYFEEGNPEEVVAPDVFVARGVPKGQRRTYKVWEEGTTPELVVELISRGTYRKDLGSKRVLYEDLGVKEYFLFDPELKSLDPPLRAFVRQGESFEEIIPEKLASGEFSIASAVVGLELRSLGNRVRWGDPRTAEALPTSVESAETRDELEAERSRAEAAEARLAQLLRENERLRKNGHDAESE